MIPFLLNTLVLVLVVILILGVINYLSDKFGLDPMFKMIVMVIVLIVAILHFLV